MRKVGMIGIILLGLFLLSFPAGAQNAVKIGTLDLSKAFDNYEKTKEYDTELQGQSQAYQQEREQRIEKMKELQAKLALLKDDEKAKAEQEMETMKEDLKNFMDSREIDLRKIQDERIREILLDIEKVVNDFAQKQGYQLILNNRVLIYEEKGLDVTDKILEILNQDYNKGQ